MYRALLTGSLLLAAQAHAETTYERARANGFVTMGFTNEMPYSYSDHGKLTGADAVVAAHVLEKLGIKDVVGVLTEFQSLIPGLRARRFDLNSTMFTTPARCKQIMFTVPVWVAINGAIVKAANPKRIDGFDAIAANPDIKAGVLAGAVYRQSMISAGVKEAQITIFPDQPSALAAVRTGRVDAFVNTGLGNQSLLDAANDPSLARATPFKQPEANGRLQVGYGALGFRAEDKDFYDAFNKELAAFVGTPEHLQLVRPFGLTEEEVMPAKGRTPEELCKE